MISKESCETEDWSNDAENSALNTEINDVLKYKTVDSIYLYLIIFHNITVLLYVWCSHGEQKGILSKTSNNP